MKIDELHSAMVAAFKTLFLKAKTVETHNGRFNLEELGTISTKAPAVFVSFLTISSVEEAGDDRMDLNCQFAAYLVADDAKGLKRDAAAKNMAEAITVWLPNNRFGVEGVGAPAKISATNLYSGKARSKAVALWAISWEQKIRVGDSIFDEDGLLPEHVYSVNDGEQTEVTG